MEGGGNGIMTIAAEVASEVVEGDPVPIMHLSLCSQPSEEVVKEVTEYSLAALEKIEKARTEGNYHEVVKVCRECLEKQEPVLADTHLYHLRILSLASEVLSYLQFFDEAAGFARKMVEGYMKLYHPNNAQLGMATMRGGRNALARGAH
ncbi:hypothetical protein SKAU_G00347910 [Synaphobranchus kaupii]|uniref:Uncharacterized protein n=1 Tax=Synaphobranchus kaupii TaxID=118154 RepID=A0A9Q1EK10_SYNKA|nr:hypothetical protein SKAU_G00347910 [Synaphobranchus kaupii]